MNKKEIIIEIKESKGTFSLFKTKEEKYDFEGLSSLKKILSNEKARVLDTIKYKNPGSIYEISKMLKRPFKAVFDDVKLLERFGFIELIENTVKGRTRQEPKIIVDEMVIKVKI